MTQITSTNPRIQARLDAFYAKIATYGFNWDGYEATAPFPGPIDITAQFLASLDEEAPEPFVSASTTGGVMLEWETRQVSVLLDFHDGYLL